MKYFGYYEIVSDNKVTRNCTLAAINKMTYIARAINKIIGKVDIISAASAVKGEFFDSFEIVEQNISLRCFKSKKYGNVILRIFQRYIFYFNLFKWCIFNVKKNETLVVYHSLGYMWLFKALKAVKHIRLILEVEEIFSDVTNNKSVRKKEMKYFELADAYIFPTQLLDSVVNVNKKPAVIIHGTYQVESSRKCKIFREDLRDGVQKTIHCVYAGTLDPRKGGAVAAAAAAEFLPNNYHMHILGFGSDEDVLKMKDLISEIQKKSKAKVTYDGVLSGEGYIEFIQSCDIGLSTQDPTASFNGTSFPSKVLSYLANGLRVVSIKIPAIEQSSVGDMLYYYTEQTPEQIAKAIQTVQIDNNYDSRSRIARLASEFEENLKKIL